MIRVHRGRILLCGMIKLLICSSLKVSHFDTLTGVISFLMQYTTIIRMYSTGKEGRGRISMTCSVRSLLYLSSTEFIITCYISWFNYGFSKSRVADTIPDFLYGCHGATPLVVKSRGSLIAEVFLGRFINGLISVIKEPSGVSKLEPSIYLSSGILQITWK